MNVVCPSGHESHTADYCDQCGAPITPSPSVAPPAGSTDPAPAPPDAAADNDEVETSTSARQEPCPQCGAQRTGDDRFCEGCGYDFAAPPGNGPAAAAAWELVASADRAQFDKLAPQGLEFPPDYVERRYPLTDDEVKIGRTHEPAEAPDINLSGAPEDPAISHMHAVLERQNDGSYKLRDLGSTNGTTMNDDPTPVSADVGAPLVDGDRIRIGAWTMLTLHRTGSS